MVKLLNSFFNFIFGWALDFGEGMGIIIISFLLTLMITLVYKKFTDQEIMKSLKQEIKDLSSEAKKYKDDPKKALDMQKKAMEKNLEYFKHSLKPMLITMLPLLIIYSWLGGVFKDGGAILFGLSWIWIYIISSFIFSILLRKVLKVN